MAWNVRAVLFAEISKNHAQRIAVPRVESYSVDTALDTDSDSFTVSIGDPDNRLHRLLMRDNEVRVNLFGGSAGNLEELQQGFADQVGLTEDGVLVISGRDLSCLATDSTAKPHDQRNYRPHKAIEKEARALGFREFSLDKVPPLKRHYTDGSETYWEKWYRAYRKRGRWMWLEPNGVLKADILHYTHTPYYRFGRPPSGGQANRWIPVQDFDFQSRKQGRVGIAQVIGQANNIGVIHTEIDKSIKNWIRRPFQLFQDDDVNSRKEARKAAFEEIFEAKVGAIEITITISHPGYIIRQNRMCRLRIPEAGIDGDYFVVGNTIIGGPEGAIQRVRLRQKGFAISRRIPDDPKLEKPPSAKVSGAMGEALGVRWGESFVSAARKWHGAWPHDLFLACLLAICRKETGFRNVRYSGSTEWYSISGGGREGGAAAYQRHRRLFANHIDNPLNPLYPRSDAAVGPMQLVTRAFKVYADQHGGKSGEYDGGRWMPDSNIHAGARALAGKLSGFPVSEANLFYAIGHRYYGSSSAAANNAYARDIRRMVYTDPGYLGIVREARSQAEDLNTSGGGSWGGSKPIADQFKRVAVEKYKLQVISAKRSRRNTSSGGVSDHWTGNKIAYAYDLSNSTHVTPQMDAFAREAVRMCGGSYNGKSELVYSKIIDGYRIQILYRTYVGGNHFNHVHVGVRKV